MRLIEFDDFMRLAHFFNNSIGIQPYVKPGLKVKTSRIKSVIFWANIINLLVILTGEIFFVYYSFSSGTNFLEATITLSYIGFASMGVFKMSSVWWKRDVLTQLVGELNEMFPKTAELQEMFKMPFYLRRCTFVTVGFSGLYMFLIAVFTFFYIMQYLIYERWLKIRVIEQELPYPMYVPWDWHNHWTYYVIFILLNIGSYCAAVGQISCDLLLCSMATQLIMHYDYVARRIEEYTICYRPDGGEQDKLNDLEFLKEIVAYHDKALNLSELLNDVFGVPLLFNFMTSSGVICFVGFQMTIGVELEQMFKSFVGVFSTTTQIYLICQFGQMLIESSTSISTAVYNQDWSNADLYYKKMLVLIAQRAQQPAFLQATTFVQVSRDTVTEIMQMSYKFLALLRTMYAD